MSIETEPSAAHGVNNSWGFSRSRGFLLASDPIADLRQVETGLEREQAAAVQEMGDALPALIRRGQLRAELDELPVLPMSPAIAGGDGRVVERLFQVYAHTESTPRVASPGRDLRSQGVPGSIGRPDSG